jgi:hypothetical protein
MFVCCDCRRELEESARSSRTERLCRVCRRERNRDYQARQREAKRRKKEKEELYAEDSRQSRQADPEIEPWRESLRSGDSSFTEVGLAEAGDPEGDIQGRGQGGDDAGAAPQDRAMSEEPDFTTMQHLCTCMIDLANEHLTIVARNPDDPVSWPEIRVLQEVHGEEAVYDVRPVALGAHETPMREKQRLALIYGAEAVEAVYAGKAFHMEWFVPGWPLDPAKAPKRKPDRPKAPAVNMPDAEATDARF